MQVTCCFLSHSALVVVVSAAWSNLFGSQKYLRHHKFTSDLFLCEVRSSPDSPLVRMGDQLLMPSSVARS